MELQLDGRELRVVEAVQEGFPLVERPFLELGRRVGLSEEGVIQVLADLRARGVIRRMGVVVRHHELGYHANAMVVWDLPEGLVREVGQRLATFDFVSLCYQRRRALPEWPFNLYCMIHGQEREVVLRQVELLTLACGLESYPRRVLFSVRRFKQCGARYRRARHGMVEFPREHAA